MTQVTFSSTNIASVTAKLDTTPVSITSGYGGWEVVNRPRKKGLTQFVGKDPMRMTVPILFDGFKDTKGQEIAISRLSRMGLPPTNGAEPPVVKVDGPGVPDPGPDEWVIESLQWGQNVIWESVGGVMVRTRQDCVVNLLEYVDPDREALKSLPGLTVTSGSNSKKKLPTWVAVKSGQTLQQIAKAAYGDASKWKKIADANNIRDPRNLPKRVRIP